MAAVVPNVLNLVDKTVEQARFVKRGGRVSDAAMTSRCSSKDGHAVRPVSG